MDLNYLFTFPPYRMVLINFISLVSFFLFSLYLYRQKSLSQKSYVIILTLASALPILSIFRQGTYESGDLSINAIKLMSFYDSLSEGIVIPRWSGELNAGFGYPNFIFAYPLPYYLSSLFHFIGFSFINSIKALLVVSYIASGLGTYIWLKRLSDSKPALVGAIAYLFHPYHLIDMHFRVAIGEMLAMAIVPFTFYCIERFNESGLWKTTFAILIGLLIISHQAVSLIAIPFILIYGLFRYRNRQFAMFNFCRYLSLGILLAAFYWLPVLAESRFTHQSIQENIEFLSIHQMLYSPYLFGFLNQGPTGQLALTLGYPHLLILLISTFLVIKSRIRSNIVRLIVICIWLLIFLLVRPSQFIWRIVPLIQKMQFSYRLYSLISLLSSVLASFLFHTLSKRIQRILLFPVILVIMTVTILNWGNRRPIPEITDDVLRSQLPESTAKGEGLQPAIPLWVDLNNPWQQKVPAEPIELLQGRAEIIPLGNTSVHHSYLINSYTTIELKENTYYFPGWSLKVNGTNRPINPNHPQHKGIITFSLPEGVYLAELTFNDTPARTGGFYISVISVITLIILNYVKPDKLLYLSGGKQI